MTPLQREALQMCLEYIETDAHERRHVRWKINEALAEPATEEFSAVQPAAQSQQEPSGWQKIECPICGDMAIATDIPAAQPQQEPVAWAISYDGETPYAIWPDGDGALLDLEVKRQGGTTCKLPLYTKDQI